MCIIFQIWDLRKPDKCERQFTAHSGPIFALDWHPEDKHWLATAGRDKAIKVGGGKTPTLDSLLAFAIRHKKQISTQKIVTIFALSQIKINTGLEDCITTTSVMKHALSEKIIPKEFLHTYLPTCSDSYRIQTFV